MTDETTTAAPEDTTTAPEAVETVEEVETDPPGAESLGDPGKRALDAMKTAKKEAEARARDLENQLAALEAKANGKEAEYEAALEAQRIKDEALSLANQRILKAEIRAAAAGKLADPQDALLHIDVSSFEVGDDGEVDGDAVTSAISDLISRKPYLAVQDGKRFQGTADGGARNDATKVGQLSEQDVKRLAAEGKHDEIVRAKAEGRLTDYLAS